ncbi:Leo1-like protein-domain-containing protein [Infundibulicybe gibba]|nr:Leo1-like protein-domain-containing protein [Infundibulicybe gibba]
MSSLAGALDEPLPVTKSYQITSQNDVEMQSSSRVHAKTNAADRPDEEMMDLFGNDNDVEETKLDGSPPSPTTSGHESERLPSPEREHRQALEYEEEDIPPEIAIEVKEAEVAFPNLPVPKSSTGDNWVIRMPNYVKVDSKPYHPDTYVGPEHEDEEAQQAETLREKSMTIKLKVENTVRWRWVKDETGQDRRQSNSRIIRWSDGTLSLRLGKELFDVNESIDTSASIPRQSVGGPSASQSQSSQLPSQSQSSAGKMQGLTYLVAQHKRSQVLQSEAVVTGYLSLRPTGMQSKTHEMLVRAVGQKHNKVARLRMAPDPTRDPEREKMELIKQDAKKSKKKVDTEDGFGGGKKRRYSRKTAGRDVWSDDEDVFAGSDEDEDEVAGTGSSGRKSRKKDDEKKGPEDYQEDDFVVADTSDEEAGSPSGRKKRDREGNETEEDPLDRLDAKIMEQQDAKRRHRESGTKGDKGSDDEGENGMDVESEEEEDELKVRRLGGSGSRKRAAVTPDEDEDE